MGTTRILIADDDAAERSGLRRIVSTQPDLEVVDEAGTAQETTEKAIGLKPDILLLDIAMPGLNGLEVARLIREQAAEVRIIILTMYDDKTYLHQSLKMGAAGYVLKKAADRELVDAIRAVQRGEPFIYPSLMGQIIDSYVKQPSPPPPCEPGQELSLQEEEVLRLLALGHTSQQISDQLCISVNTVEIHRAHIVEKLGLRGRAQLFRYALAKGLLKNHQD